MHAIFYRSILVSFVLTIFFGCSSDEHATEIPNDEPTNLEAITMLDQSYGTHTQQTYDIYLPEGRSSDKTKIILLVHGGGWTSGDKADMNEFVTLFQDKHPAHAIVNMNYVLATLPSTPAFPNQFLDIDAVIDKLTVDHQELHIQPEFGLIGVSAGAHLSLQYDYVYDTDDQVKFVADIVGPTDFTDPFYTNDPQFQFALDFLVDANQYPDGTNLAVAVSPALQVSDASSPSLLFYGTDDPLVPLSNGDRLDSALSQHNITHKFSIYAGGHGNDWSEADMLQLEHQVSTYITTYLGID